jgi:molybdenum cofactor guanylyltransferase
MGMFIVVIQAGGESKRMGRDKGLVPFLGRPLVQRVLERVSGIAQEVLVITNRPEEYRFLGVRLQADEIPGRGALGGLYTALYAAKELGADMAAVVACDLPFASPALLDMERRLLDETIWDAAIPRSEAGTEQFHAVYRLETCLPLVKVVLDGGKWRADAWFSQARIRFLRPEEAAAYNPDGLVFMNVNTPQELQRAEEMARSLGEIPL